MVNVYSPFASSAPTNGDIVILFKWNGNFPVARLAILSEGQRTTPVGYIGDEETFNCVWQAFKPGETLPEVDFSKNLIVFVRNVDFYNSISIAKCTVKEGVVEILAMQTMSAIPIEEKVSMSLAVIPRAGLKFIDAGELKIPVLDKIYPKESSAKSPDQACYLIEKQEVCLINGQSKVEAAPGSATKTATSIFGQTVYGDLDGNGADDAVILLIQNSGGSATFYYVAAAININAVFKGTNAISLGDRICPQNILIQKGLIVVNYADRKSDEAMTVPCSIGISRHLSLKGNELVETESYQ
jgi:hypothetical protein